MTARFEEKRSPHARTIEYELTASGCWICTSHTKDRAGYPIVWRNGRFRRMCRYVYEVRKGEIPEGFVIMHACDNPGCINPDHLNVGTSKENSEDMVSKGRQAKGVKNGGGVKLDEQKVRAIRSDPGTLQAIADRYGVSKKLILNVKKRRNWRHVQ